MRVTAYVPGFHLHPEAHTGFNCGCPAEEPVIITAHTFKHWDTKENKIIGGDSIAYWSKSIIFIEKTGKTSERKSTNKAVRETSGLVLTYKGNIFSSAVIGNI